MVARLTGGQEVAGSSPVAPIFVTPALSGSCEVLDAAKNNRIIFRCIAAFEYNRLIASQASGFADLAIVKATVIIIRLGCELLWEDANRGEWSSCERSNVSRFLDPPMRCR